MKATARYEAKPPSWSRESCRIADTDIFATGRYLDLYRIEDGKARLNERTVVCDSSRIDTLMALPL